MPLVPTLSVVAAGGLVWLLRLAWDWTRSTGAAVDVGGVAGRGAPVAAVPVRSSREAAR
jgi:hypothetical protein